MVDYQVDVTKDWRRWADGSSHRSFTITPEWCGPGSWRASWPVEHEGARDMLAGVASGEDVRRWGVALRARGASSTGVAGFCTSVTLVDGEVSGYERDSIVATGLTDTGLLAGALSYPDPSDDSTTGLHGWTVYTDGPWANAETAMLDLIRDNLGQAALTRRKMTVLTVPASLGRGGSVTYSRRFPTLLEAVRDICLTSGLTVRVARSPGALSVVVEPQARRDEVRWSRLAGTLAGAAVTYGSDGATSVLVGGKRTTEDDELTRQFARVDRTPPAGGYAYPREVFRDATSADTLADLQAEGAEELAERAGVPSVELTPVTSAPYAYGVDYRVGDLTPVDVGSGVIVKRTVVARVESVTISHARSGAWVSVPQIGPPLGDPVAVQRQVFRALNGQRKR